MKDELLSAVAETFGTPTYVYDLDVVTQRFRQVQAAFPGAHVHYAVKANALGPLLAHLAALGARAEALTAGELARALRAGFPPAHVVLGGPGHGPALAREAGAAGVALVSLDSVGAWHVWRDVEAPSTRFLVRLNPGFDPHTHEHLATAAAESKFGMPVAEAERVATEVAQTGRLAGFHVHAGSMLRDPSVAKLVVDALEPLYDRFEGLELVDFGGGFAVPDLDLRSFARPLLAFAEERALTPIVEPGRFLVAEAGVLLTRVLHVKRGGPLRHVVADAGMADLLRPALYGAEHPVRLIGAVRPSTAAGERTDLDGPLCENADRLGRDVDLGEVEPGDLIAVGLAGAYGFAMASNYASSTKPAQVVTAGGTFSLAARRETVQDLWRLEAAVAGAVHEDPRATVTALLDAMDSPARAAAALLNVAADHVRPKLGTLEDLTRAFSNELYRPLMGVGAEGLLELDERDSERGPVARARITTGEGDFVLSLASRLGETGRTGWRVTGLARDLPGS